MADFEPELFDIIERLRRLALSQRGPVCAATTAGDVTSALLMNVVGVLNCVRIGVATTERSPGEFRPMGSPSRPPVGVPDVRGQRASQLTDAQESEPEVEHEPALRVKVVVGLELDDLWDAWVSGAREYEATAGRACGVEAFGRWVARRELLTRDKSQCLGGRVEG